MKRHGMQSGRFLALSLLITLIGCSGGGGSSSAVGGTPADVSGTWNIQESITGNCPQQQTSDQYTVNVTQNGSSITVTAGGDTFQGSVNGNTVSWLGNYEKNGGTVTVTGMSLTVNGGSLSGGATWTWTDGSVACSGSTQVTGTRTSGGGGGGTVNANGTWQIDETYTVTSGPCQSGSDTYTIQVTQNGSSITVTVGSLTLNGTLQGSQLVWSGSYPDAGGTTTTSISATIQGDTLAGSSNWSWTDGIESCTGTSTFTGNRIAFAFYTPMLGTWRWQDSVIRAIGESPWQVGETLVRDFEVASSGGELVVRIGGREVPASFDENAGQLMFKDSGPLPAGGWIHEELSIIFDIEAGVPVAYGLREWTVDREGRVLAEGTSSLDGERVVAEAVGVGAIR